MRSETTLHEGFLTDINARKKAEAALQEAQALLESKVEERTQALVAAIWS